MRKNKNLTTWIIALPIIAVLITATILTYEFIQYEKKELSDNIKNFEEKYLEELQKRIKNRVNRTIKLIEANAQTIKEEEKEEIKTVTNIGYNIIEQTYKQNLKKPKNEIIKTITKRLENQRFYKDHSGYFFIINLNNTVLMNSSQKNHTNTNQTNLKDIKGKYFIQSLTNLVKKKNEGFDTWHWKKIDTNEIVKKIGYAKLFKPLGIYIVNSKSLYDIEKRIKRSTKKIVDTIKYSKNEYLFAINTKGTTVSHVNKEFVGKAIETRTKVEQEIIKKIIKHSKKKDGGYIDYTPTSFNIAKELSRKISYVKKVPSMDWIIGTGQYTKTLEQRIQTEKDELHEEVIQTRNKIILISIAISAILISILIYISRRLELQFLDYESEVSLKNKKLEELNQTLEKRVIEQIKKNREKEEILHHQSKLASMGEMLGNIAHQWRQPLSTISTAASGIKIQDELGTLEKNSMYSSLDAIVTSTQVLSQTIDDFRNFFSKDKSKTFFNINSSLQKVFTLVQASFKNKNIEIIENTCDCELYGLENELTQALLNIISNAKDAVIEKNDKGRKLIFISSFCTSKHVHIKILDNGGGVKDELLDKIFEPYFTTKFKSQGTGIGLYMTQTIVTSHMKGKLNVRNLNYVHENEKYAGAEFEIVIDKDKKEE